MAIIMPTTSLNQLAIPNEFRGATVAVAEDNSINQRVIAGLLEFVGIRVCMADNGKALLEMLETEEHPAELIFMDIHMPKMNGYETTQILRARGYTGPIIAVSAGVSPAERSRCTDAGMNDFLPKPIELDALWAVLTRWLKPRESSLPPPALSPVSATTEAGPLADAGIVAEEALARFLGDAPALWRAINVFLVQHRQDAAAMRTLLQAGRLSELEKLAHGLKGAAATMGARKLASLARALEDHPEQASRQKADELINEVAAALGKIEDAARSHQTADKR